MGASNTGPERLIFTVTTGRSGTGYLARLLDLLPEVGAFHEPEPKFSHHMRHAQRDPERARRFLIEEKLPAVAATSQPIYAETSHLFCKGFVEPLLDLGFTADLILLRREPRDVATSLYRLNTVPGRTQDGLRFLLHPGDVGVLPLPGWETLHDYQLCYWYVLEVERRMKAYRGVFGEAGRVAETSLEAIRTEVGFRRLLDDLRLPGWNANVRDAYLATRDEVINAKREAKAHHRRPPLENVERLEREVLARVVSAGSRPRVRDR